MERAAMALATVALTLAIIFRRRITGTVLAILGFVVFTALDLPQTREVGAHSDPAQYNRLLQAWNRIEKLRQGHALRFWYDQREANFAEYSALAALYLEDYSRLGNQFPAGCQAPVDPGTLVVVTTAKQGAAELARGALADCWRPLGMHPELEASETLHAPDQPYAMVILRAEADPARWRPLRAVFDSAGKAELEPVGTGLQPIPLPPERWATDHYPVDNASLRPVVGGMEVHTPVRQYYFATRFAPLAAPFTGQYHFVLKVRNRRGHFAFGARTSDDSNYLAVDSYGHPVGDHREMSFWLNLKLGETVLLRTANNDLTDFGAASFVIEQLSVSGIAAE
jgi:hypothetical protein